MKGKKKKLAIIAGGVLLVVLAAVGTFFILKAAGASEIISDASGEAERKRASTEKGEKESRPGESREESGASDEAEAGLQGKHQEDVKRAESEHAKELESLKQEESRSQEEAEGRAAGPLQVIGADLCDSRGNPIQLRGVSTHGIAWFPDYVNEALFRELHEQWNVNVVRLAMYTAESGGYCSGGDKEQLKQLIRNGVEYASGADMYVIIDWHILSDGDPNTYKEEAKKFFGEMSAEYADRDNILYEICNEPNGGTSWSRVKEYAEEIIPVIRENDEDAVILVGTPNWCQYVDQAAADPITGWDNIMYTLHFYAATHKESLRQTMTAARDAGLPIFVSEYSICDASGNGGIDEAQAAAWVETMDRYGISYVAWSLSNKNETAALISSSCSKLSGLTEDDLSSTGKWLYGVLTDGSTRGGGLLGSLQGMGQGGQSQSQPGNDRGGQSQSQPGNDRENPSRDSQGQPGGSTVSTGDLNITFQVVNSWESEGKHFYQYEMTVENVSGVSLNGWQADIVFNETPELSDSWNGVFTLEGSTLHISSVDYNGQLENGGTAENIGFIVSGSGNLSP
ncbi:MAG: cellulase family glycosylhydrolase [Butyrivibrio sp.]|nr:cellulase family glycosylhydrolase [Acetatifactor muris]MCM1558813.1 cellulase family glycosylhydrolase [Butyrivibrio sp.]